MTPAFLERLAAGLRIPVQGLPDFNFYGVRLRHGAADWKVFASEASAIGHGQVFSSAGNTLSIRTAAASAQRGIHLEVVALVLFGILVLLVTLLFVGQAVARQVVLEADDYATLRTLGVTRSQLVSIVVMRAAVIGFAGAAIALLVAALSSPLLPVGLARQAEIHPGLTFDAAILVPGAFALVALVCAGALIPAWHASRRQRQYRATRGRLARWAVNGCWVLWDKRWSRQPLASGSALGSRPDAAAAPCRWWARSSPRCSESPRSPHRSRSARVSTTSSPARVSRAGTGTCSWAIPTTCKTKRQTTAPSSPRIRMWRPTPR